MGSTSNVGVLETRQDEVELAVTIRSTDTKRFYNYQQLKRLCARLGVKTELICELPEWEYSVSDEWMEMLRKMYPEYPPTTWAAPARSAFSPHAFRALTPSP